MKKTILETMVALALATSAAQASTIPLQHAVITATYNGAASGMLGLDFLTGSSAVQDTTAIDPANDPVNIEFLSADALFGFDFGTDGSLKIMSNGAIPAGAYAFRFDFGDSLANPIDTFTLTDGSGASGLPGLTVEAGGHAIDVDLSQLTWNDTFATISAQIATVPEPASLASLLIGAGALALSRRRKRAA